MMAAAHRETLLHDSGGIKVLPVGAELPADSRPAAQKAYFAGGASGASRTASSRSPTSRTPSLVIGRVVPNPHMSRLQPAPATPRP
jgi:hypothetical protein